MPTVSDATAALADRVRHRLVDAGEDLASVIADEVTLSSRWSPPVVSDFFPRQLRLLATARAHVIIR